MLQRSHALNGRPEHSLSLPRDAFDQAMVGFIPALSGLYPPGGLVELASGEVGIVISNNQSRLKPTIMLRLNAQRTYAQADRRFESGR